MLRGERGRAGGGEGGVDGGRTAATRYYEASNAGRYSHVGKWMLKGLTQL